MMVWPIIFQQTFLFLKSKEDCSFWDNHVLQWLDGKEKYYREGAEVSITVIIRFLRECAGLAAGFYGMSWTNSEVFLGIESRPCFQCDTPFLQTFAGAILKSWEGWPLK